MSLLFNWYARNGSYIEDVSKTAGSVTIGTGSFKRTEKGIAFYNKQSYINFGNLTAINTIGTGDFSIEFWVKKESITAAVSGVIDKGRFSSTNELAIYFTTTSLRVGIMSASLFSNAIGASDINIWRHFIITRQGNVYTLYKDGIYHSQLTHPESLNWNNSENVNVGARTGSVSQYLDGFIGGVRIYNKSLDTSERNRLYQAYLQLQITEKPVRGFELVKPTDLSYQKDRGLLAAYNFKRNGDTLVDISGNGYNFTIDPGTVERDNGLYFPMTRATITPLITFPAGSKTVCWRGTVYSIPGNYARIYGTYVMFSANMSLLYFRAGSLLDSVVQIGTGLDSSNFGQEFDLVYVQEGNSTQKLYVNGVLVGTSNTTTTSAQQIGDIGSTGATAGNILFKDLRFYTRAFSEQEIKDYHNSFIKPIILEDWSGSAVGDVI